MYTIKARKKDAELVKLQLTVEKVKRYTVESN